MSEVTYDDQIGILDLAPQCRVEFILHVVRQRPIVHLIYFEELANIGGFDEAGLLDGRPLRAMNKRGLDRWIEPLAQEFFVRFSDARISHERDELDVLADRSKMICRRHGAARKHFLAFLQGRYDALLGGFSQRSHIDVSIDDRFSHDHDAKIGGAPEEMT